MTTFGKTVVWTLIIIILLGASTYAYVTYYMKSEPVITSYEECVAAGNPIMESYPPQCMTKDGQHFTGPGEVQATSTASTTPDRSDQSNAELLKDKIVVTNISNNQKISSPLIIKGKAVGGWYFEASFPVFVADWDGKIVGQGVAQAQGDWMTSDFVPFTATVTFSVDPNIYSKNATLILQKDNPSGMPENDEALEMPVMFQ